MAETALSTETLKSLAEGINEHHAAFMEAGRKGAEHACEAGKQLIKAKTGMKHGEWLPWLKQNCDVSHSEAWRYMQVASNIARVQHLEPAASSMRGILATIKDEKRAVRERDKAVERQEQAVVAREKVGPVDDNDYGVITGDFREHADRVSDNSVDLIFCDPPYDRDSVGLYGDLAEFGAAKLVNGGSLMCYAGHYLLPDIFKLMTPHLRYWWMCGCYHTGQLARMTEYGIVVHWKPILWFVKVARGDKNAFIDDLVSGGQEKSHHKWQQAENEAAYYIEKLCHENGLVVDPFCGGGTTAVAAINLDRYCTTFEIDKDSADIARSRIKDIYVPPF